MATKQKINKVYKFIVYINTYVQLVLRTTGRRLLGDG